LVEFGESGAPELVYQRSAAEKIPPKGVTAPPRVAKIHRWLINQKSRASFYPLLTSDPEAMAKQLQTRGHHGERRMPQREHGRRKSDSPPLCRRTAFESHGRIRPGHKAGDGFRPSAPKLATADTSVSRGEGR